ncbi:MAG: DUF5693 family protein [Bacillota bacterium]
MSKKGFSRYIIAAFIIISIISVLSVAWQRMQVEDNNKSVEIVLDYVQFRQVAEQSEHDLLWWLKKLKELGADSIGIPEVTLWDYLNEYNIYYSLTGSIKNTYNWEADFPAAAAAKIKSSDQYDLLIHTDNKSRFDFIAEKLDRYKELKWEKTAAEGHYFIIIDQSREDIINISLETEYSIEQKKQYKLKETVGTEALGIVLGFDPAVMDYIGQSGLSLVLRPVNNYQYSKVAYDIYLEELKKYDNKRNLVLFSGKQVVGFGEDYDSTMVSDLVNINKMTIGLVEPVDQRLYIKTDGLEEALDKIKGSELVRVFSVPEYIQKRYKYYNYDSVQEITNSLYRAITERNVGVIYLNPVIKDDYAYLTDIKEYELMFNDLKARIAKHGYSLGKFSTFEDFSTSLWTKILLSAQVMLFGLILFNIGVYRFNTVMNTVFTLLLLIFTAGAFYAAPNFSVKVFALGAAIIFSSLSVTIFVKRYLSSNKVFAARNRLFTAVEGLLLSVSISLMGALYVGTIMADVRYFLELEIFTGVKVSVILPILVVIFIVLIHNMDLGESYSIREVFGSVYKKTRYFMNIDIKVKYMVMLVLVGLIGYIYIARTGHASSIINPEWEINIRNYLESILLARPRTKELFISFPLTILAAYLFRYVGSGILKNRINERIFVMIAAVLAIVGQSSITNTFSHIRTPLYMSLYRTAYSVLFGAMLGVVMIFAAKILLRLMMKKAKTSR